MPSLSDAAQRESGLDSEAIQRLVDVARRAALAGALPLRDLLGQLESVRAKGGAGNLVTEADLAAEAAVLAVLRQETPGVPVLAEEGGRLAGEGPLEWCVDPLDGTTNYAHGFPFFGTSVGLTWEGKPLVGAIALPMTQELFWAAPGLGAWCNETRLTVSSCQKLEDALLATGFAYDRI